MALQLSVLDLIPVGTGATTSQALANSLALARRADELGYHRYWYAEHHNTRGFASTAPEILIALAARETKRIRVGSGGIMLPNHPPLRVAENFRTLESLYPGRIDLGIGRAPGTDQRTALALRRSVEALTADEFPSFFQELLAFAGQAEFDDEHPFRNVEAVPDDVTFPPIWILGSSGYGARLAAAIGRGFAFAFHFSPESALPAMQSYRSEFQPSAHLQKPHAILAVAVVCAETNERAEELATTHDLLWVNISNGRTGRLPSPEEAKAYPYTPRDLEAVRRSRSSLVVGSPERVRDRLNALAEEMEADELMITSHIHDHAARVRSYELIAKCCGDDLHKVGG